MSPQWSSDLILSVDRMYARSKARDWWRWKKDGRWSTWHRLSGAGLPQEGTWTLCDMVTVPAELDEVQSVATPVKFCRRCERATAHE